MTTVTTPMRAPAEPGRVTHVNHWLVAAVIVLAAALAGLGAWALADRLSDSESTAAVLVDDVVAGINAGDASAAAADYAEDATASMYGDELTGTQAIEGWLQNAIDAGTQIERVSDVIVDGEYATAYFHWTNDLGMDGSDLSVFRLQDGLIAGQWSFYLNDWPPDELGG